MQIATALLLSFLWIAASAGPRARPKRPLLQTLKAAHSECSRPGPRLAELVDRGFDALLFGKEVIPDWDRLSDKQKSAFATLADAVIGSEERRGYAKGFCQMFHQVTWVGKLGADAITRVKTKFVVEGETEYAELWFRDDGDRWTFIDTWCCGVNVFILTWRDKFKGGYEAAMTKLRESAP